MENIAATRNVRKHRQRPFPTSNLSAIGIDIGSRLLKMVQLVNDNGEIKVFRKAHHPVPMTLYRDRAISDYCLTAEIIRKVYSQYGFRGKRAVTSMPPDSFYFTKSQMPDLPKKEFHRAARLEMLKSFSLDENNAVVAYCPAEFRKNIFDGKTEYFIIGSERRVADSFGTSIAQAGLKLDALDISPFAMIRSLTVSNGGIYRNGTLPGLIINIGALNTICIINEGPVLIHYRSFKFGLNDLIVALNKSGVQKDKISLIWQSLFSRKEALKQYFSAPIRKLVDQLALSINYWQEQTDYKETGESKLIYLQGGGSLIAGLPDLLDKELGLKTISRNNMRLAGKNSPLCSIASYEIACGLAFREWAR